jgi:uncharacterized cupin superfamily protein
MPVDEARSEETPYGRYVTSDGWFVLNLSEALAVRNEKSGATYPIEGRDAPFRDFGLNVRVLRPGEPMAMYHAEEVQEGFLVLSGECTLIVEEQERQLRQWDYFHCPRDTGHVIVGAGEEPCAVLAVGIRPKEETLRYPRSELAARHGASAPTYTESPEEAYAAWPDEYVPERLPWPPGAGS